MGIGGYTDDHDYNAEARKIVDCKDWAVSAEKIGGLTAVRGYAIFDQSFTEHWWCVDSAGRVVDPTGLSKLASRLVPLANQADERPCLSYEGHCLYETYRVGLKTEPRCAWCTTRKALETLRQTRMPMAPIRFLIDRLVREQQRIRVELDDIRAEIRRSKK